MVPLTHVVSRVDRKYGKFTANARFFCAAKCPFPFRDERRRVTVRCCLRQIWSAYLDTAGSSDFAMDAIEKAEPLIAASDLHDGNKICSSLDQQHADANSPEVGDLNAPKLSKPPTEAALLFTGGDLFFYFFNKRSDVFERHRVQCWV
jgi:hypothetical protein